MIQSIFNKNQSQNQRVIIFNAVFLIALLLFNLADPMAVVFAYVFETVIIGVFHVAKLIVAISSKSIDGKKKSWTSYFFIPFFLLHYGFFVAIQTIIIYTIFAIGDDRFSTSLSLSNILSVFELEGFYTVVASIVGTHLFDFFFRFLKSKKYQTKDLILYAFKPYLRVFVQQFLAIIPLCFMFFHLEIGLVAAILLVIMRAALDLYLFLVSQSPERLNYWIKTLSSGTPEDLEKVEKGLVVFLE